MLDLRLATGEAIGVSGGDAVPSFSLAADCRAALVFCAFLPIVRYCFWAMLFSSLIFFFFFLFFLLPFEVLGRGLDWKRSKESGCPSGCGGGPRLTAVRKLVGREERH